MCAVAYWSRRAARLHSSIRGLSPQAGGFRRRSNRPSSVSRVTGLAHDPYERLPCVQQVLTRHLLFRIILQYAAVFQPRVLFLFQGNAQYITNRALLVQLIIQFLRPRNTKRGNHIVKRYISQKPCFLRTSPARRSTSASSTSSETVSTTRTGCCSTAPDTTTNLRPGEVYRTVTSHKG